MTATDTTQNIKSQPRDARGRVLAKVVSSPLADIYQAVDAALVAVRQRHPEIPNVYLVVGASGVRPGGNLNLGHFAPKSWQAAKDKKMHEIVISGESLKEGPVDVLGTILHESAHALAEARGIKDTSRQGRFHNKRFKAVAEELGIEVEHSKSIGWSKTTVPAATLALYKPQVADIKKALKGYRLIVTKAAKPATTVRCECDCRGITLPITFLEKGLVRCEDCKEVLEPIIPLPGLGVLGTVGEDAA